MVESTTLQHYSLFGGLMTEQIDRILPLMEQETFSPGEYIVTEGTPNDRIRFILEGRVAVIKEEALLTEFGEGDEFGEMEVLEVMPSAATIKTLAPTRVLSISNRGLRQIYKSDAQTFALIIMNLARDLSRRLRRMNERVAPSGTQH